MMDEQVKPLLNDDDTLVSAKSKYGIPIPVYDDSYGPLWVFQQSWGVAGVVRAQDWDSVESIIRDEILKPIDAEDVLDAYGYRITHTKQGWIGEGPDKTILVRAMKKSVAEQVCGDHMNGTHPELAEGYSYQDNATGTGIVAHDLNGESHEILTPELISELGLVIEAEDADGNAYCVSAETLKEMGDENRERAAPDLRAGERQVSGIRDEQADESEGPGADSERFEEPE